jgi:hypothetical protein
MFITEGKAAVVLLVLALPGTGIYASAALDESAREAAHEERQRAADAPAGAEVKNTIQIHGRVLDPDSKPLPAARVFALAGLARAVRSPEDYSIHLTDETKTDAKGRFELRVHAPGGEPPPSPMHPLPAIFVLADGHGVGLQAVTDSAKKEQIVIRLPREQVLRARFMDDTNGKPVEGLVVKVASVGHGGGMVNPPAQAPKGWFPPMKTDAQGRLQLHGIGAGQWVFVEWRDARFQAQRVDLWRTEAHWSGQEVVSKLMPPLPEFVSGRVTFKDTGKPAAGMSVRAPGDKTKTDGEGRFRLKPDWELRTSLTFGATSDYVTTVRALVEVDAPAGAAYLGGRGEPELARIPRRDGTLGPWQLGELQIALPRGIRIQGRVLEGGTDKGIHGASVGFGMSQATSGPDGAFSLTTAAGSGHLVVKAATADYAPVEAKVGVGRLIAHAIVPVDFKESTDPKPVQIFLRRGAVVKGKLTGPDGQPAQGAVLISRLMVNQAMNVLVQSPSPAPSIPVSADFALKGCHPEKPYPAIFFQEQKGWGALVHISGQEASKPLEVRLQPCGAAKARFLTAEGRPNAGRGTAGDLLVVLGTGDTALWGGFIEHSNLRKDWHTDAQGQVTWRDLVPGVTYRVNHRDFRVTPGELLDLGDLK